MNAMILGRVIAGVGGSGMYSGTLTYVSVCTMMKERALYMAGSTVIWGIGTVLGPVVCCNRLEDGVDTDQIPGWRCICGKQRDLEMGEYRFEPPEILLII